MVNKFLNHLLVYFIIFVNTVIFYSCASEGAPPGGPKDETGPTVMKTKPTAGELFVNPKTVIEFEFSEPVNYRSIENALTIFPAPETKPVLKINRNKVKILPKEPLKKNTTYIFSFGRKVEDYQKNKSTSEVKIAFSTGSELDKSIISGRLFDYEEEKKTAYILFYDRSEKDPDSLIFYDPDYYTPVDKFGNYQATNLAAGQYSAVAYLGNFKNAPRFSETDFTAVGFEEFIVLQTGSDTLQNVNLRLNQYPLKDFSYQKSYEEEGSLQLLFSHPINYEASDISLKINNKAMQKSWYFDKNNPQNLVLSPDLDSADHIIEISGLIDIHGRQLTKVTDTVHWSNPEIIDTLGASAKFVLSGKENIPVTAKILLQFSEPVKPISDIKDRILFFDEDSNAIAFSVEQKDFTTYEFQPDKVLSYFREYFLSVNVDSTFDRFNNECSDSIITYNFKTIDDDLFGSISGKINSRLEMNKIIIGCRKIDQKDSDIYSKPDDDGNFLLDQLLPGDYEIFAYFDENENNTYDWGSLIPYQAAEIYKYFTGPISVRSRWETERVVFQF